jgi:hypothetical protein
MNFTPILQEQVRNGHWDLEQLLDYRGILGLTLLDNHSRQIKLSFNSYMAYRKLDEGDALLMLAAIQKTGGTAKYFYRVENSDFLAWFNRERCANESSQLLIHYTVAAENDIVDILALYPPTVEVE